MNFVLTSRLLLVWLLSAGSALAASDLVIADFEGSDYGAWKVTGEAFGAGPAQGTLPNQMKVDGYLGKGLVNSFYGGDGSTGTLRSPVFKVERPFIRFLIGGGKDTNKTCMHLLVNDRVVRAATGPNDRPGGSEHLDWQEWNVSEWMEQEARLEIVDQATGGWGHINVDQIIQTDRSLPRWLTNVTQLVTVQRRYLNLPVKNGAPRRQVSLWHDGKSVDQFEIELADADPDFWVFVDLAGFQGKTVVLQVDHLREDSPALQRVTQSDQIQGAEGLYQEKLRPQFHFTSRRGWNNDPNGLVFYRGEYHLFYQHNPYGWNWGNMHWGHAVSPDLLHWQELGDALRPDALGTMFSGSAVVDWHNTAGFSQGDDKPIVCIYTAAGGSNPSSKGKPFTQCLAYSTDRGRTWTKYDHNPVLPHIVGDNRDPKVLWSEAQKKWLLALYLDKSDYALFSSPDLKTWERLCDVSLPGSSECPEFFEIPVEGNQKSTRWIFYGGNGRYLVGRFNGRNFTPESGPAPLNFGNCFYASQTFNDIPAPDNRRILVAWGQVQLPGMPFNQMMDFPVELTLRTTESGLRLFANPVAEIERLRGLPVQKHNGPISPGIQPLSSVQGDLLDLSVEFDAGPATEVGLVIHGVPIVYHTAQQELVCLDKKAPLPRVAGKIRLRLLVDRASIEIFGNDGQVYMPMGVIGDLQKPAVALSASGEGAQATLTVYPLRSAWPDAQ